MSVIARSIVSTPERSTSSTWEFITDLICQSNESSTQEFKAVAGLAAACISEEAFNNHALVVISQGPRLRVYCLYGDDAISGDKRKEEALSWKPIEGEWKAYLPCTEEDFDWIKTALATKSPRFFAYNIVDGLPSDSEDNKNSQEAQATSKLISIDVGRFNEL